MPLSAKNTYLVQSSLAKVAKEYKPGSTYFYDRLFHYDPTLHVMFREDLAGQGMKFMSTLGVIVDGLNNPERLKEELSELGEGHAAMGITSAHFKPMEEALVDTMRQVLGLRFTQDLEEAWRIAFEEISRMMTEYGKMDPE